MTPPAAEAPPAGPEPCSIRTGVGVLARGVTVPFRLQAEMAPHARRARATDNFMLEPPFDYGAEKDATYSDQLIPYARCPSVVLLNVTFEAFG